MYFQKPHYNLGFLRTSSIIIIKGTKYKYRILNSKEAIRRCNIQKREITNNRGVNKTLYLKRKLL